MSLGQNASDRLARRVMWALACGVALGLAGRFWIAIQPGVAPALAWLATQVLDPIGQIFLRLLFMVVVPLVFSSIAVGVAQLGALKKLGPLAGRTFGIFALNMAVAVALGLLMMNIIRPGEHINETVRADLLEKFRTSAQVLKTAAEQQQSVSFGALVEMFLPRNLPKAIVDFQILPLISFALLVGAAATTLGPERRAGFVAALETINDLMTAIVRFAMVLAPLAVAALLAGVVLKLGTDFLKSLVLFVAGVLGVMALHLFGTMSLMLKLFSRRTPRQFFAAIRTVLVTAFSTSSSGATLPTTIQVSREKLGISESTAGFVLPLGATMNMSGTALYEGCVVLFVAQVYGVPLGFQAQLTLLLMAVLSAVAVASIPGASLPLIVVLLVNFGLPAEGIALILGIDRLLDMCRTVLNVAADIVTACIVDERITRIVEQENS